MTPDRKGSAAAPFGQAVFREMGSGTGGRHRRGRDPARAPRRASPTTSIRGLRRCSCVTSPLRSPSARLRHQRPGSRQTVPGSPSTPGHGHHRGRRGHEIAAYLPLEAASTRTRCQKRGAGVALEPVETLKLRRTLFLSSVSPADRPMVMFRLPVDGFSTPHLAAPASPQGFTIRVNPRSGKAAGVRRHDESHPAGLRKGPARSCT